MFEGCSCIETKVMTNLFFWQNLEKEFSRVHSSKQSCNEVMETSLLRVLLFILNMN